jgi:hypothetical protein
MSHACPICTHPLEHAVNCALVMGTSFRDIAGQYSVSKRTIERYKPDA